MKTLYLEERIAIVRKALNEQTTEFERLLPVAAQARFHQLVIDCLNVLDGFTHEVER